MNTLCLQAEQDLSAAQLRQKLHKLKGCTFQEPQQLKKKSQLLLAEGKLKLQRQFTRQEFALAAFPGLQLSLETGVILAETAIIRQTDIYVRYNLKDTGQVKKLIAVLLKCLPLILTEPDIKARVQQARGLVTESRKTKLSPKLGRGIIQHLAWQLYGVNQAWSKYLVNPVDRVALRQLRVKLRRLRSCLSFFKPALPQRTCENWQERLKKQGEILARIRELDVVLMSIKRLEEATQQQQQHLARLRIVFSQQRSDAIGELSEQVSLVRQTKELAEFFLWLQTQPVNREHSVQSLDEFIAKRLLAWSHNIRNLTKRYPDFANMLEAHKIRIKVKRFRYSLMSLPEVNQGAGPLLRKMKHLQDVLGFLHDDFVNDQLVTEVVQSTGQISAYEAAIFTGWEKARVEASLAELKLLWPDFCQELKSWQKK